MVGVRGLDVGKLGLRELQTGGPVVVDDVLNLLGDRLVVQRWQEGQGLEHPAFRATTQVNNCYVSIQCSIFVVKRSNRANTSAAVDAMLVQQLEKAKTLTCCWLAATPASGGS